MDETKNVNDMSTSGSEAEQLRVFPLPQTA